MSINELTNYKYRGARAVILFHEQLLRQFVETWKTAKAAGIPLPQTKDANYSSYEALLRHVLWNAREYMVWICEKLELPDPQIDQAPDPEVIDAEVDRFVEHLTRQWRIPLVDVNKKRFYDVEYKSRWLTQYCIDAMLEHAAMHLVHHRFQLLELMEK